MERSLLEYLAIAIGAGIGFMYGEPNNMLYAVLALCTFDFLTGLMVACQRHKLSSKVGFHGFFKKMAIFIMISLAHLIDKYIIGAGNTFLTAAMLYYSANEGISIVENCEKLGLPVPKKLKKILQQVKDDSDDDDKNKPSKA